MTRLLWNADSPIGWTCASCQGHFRLGSPWLTGIIAVVFGLLMIAALILLPKVPGLRGPGLVAVALLVAAGAAIWAAHELVLLTAKRRLVRVEEAPAGPWAYAVAFVLGMAATFAGLYQYILFTGSV